MPADAVEDNDSVGNVQVLSTEIDPAEIDINVKGRKEKIEIVAQEDVEAKKASKCSLPSNSTAAIVETTKVKCDLEPLNDLPAITKAKSLPDLKHPREYLTALRCKSMYAFCSENNAEAEIEKEITTETGNEIQEASEDVKEITAPETPPSECLDDTKKDWEESSENINTQATEVLAETEQAATSVAKETLSQEEISDVNKMIESEVDDDNELLEEMMQPLIPQMSEIVKVGILAQITGDDDKPD